MMDADRFNRHGRVRTVPSRSHLIHTDGTPFLFIADTAWNGALLSTDQDWCDYLDDRATKCFTAIQFITHAPWSAALTDSHDQTAMNGRVINTEFFDRIDAKIHAINQRGMLAVPVLAWAANFGQSSKLNIGHHANAETLIPFIAHQVKQFAHHHVMWVLAGDGKYNCLRARKRTKVGRAVFGKGEHAPVALHPMGVTWPYRAFKNEKWLGVFGYQSSHSEHPKMLQWQLDGPPAQSHTRPVINLEPVYEGIAPGGVAFDHHAVRRAMWRSIFIAPIAGVAYGAHGLWGWHDKPMEALNHVGMGFGLAWRDAMNLPGGTDVKQLATFLNAIEWWRLKPDRDIITQTSHAGSPHHRALVLRSDDCVLVYLPAGGSFRLNANFSSHDLRWFNPRSGGYCDCIKRNEEFKTPDDADWILVARQISTTE